MLHNFEWRNKWYHEKVKSLKEYGLCLLMKDVSETIKNKAKEHKEGFSGCF